MKRHSILILAVCALLSSCVTRYKPPMVRTTTSGGPHAFGLSGATTVTETPYESPAFTAAGEALFSRK